MNRFPAWGDRFWKTHLFPHFLWFYMKYSSPSNQTLVKYFSNHLQSNGLFRMIYIALFQKYFFFANQNKNFTPKHISRTKSNIKNPSPKSLEICLKFKKIKIWIDLVKNWKTSRESSFPHSILFLPILATFSSSQNFNM